MTDRSTGRVLADLEYCIERLGDAGYEVIVADITTPEIAEVGFSVVRVIVPGLIPLHSDHRYPFLGARRLSAVPYPLNPFPHPFP
jgi:ribosomal protein S12 methylthiotransferase accessory factor